MAVVQNWSSYEVNIGWEEVSAETVFKDSIVFKLLEEKVDADFLMDILNPTYSNGNLKFGE